MLRLIFLIATLIGLPTLGGWSIFKLIEKDEISDTDNILDSNCTEDYETN